MHCIHRISTRWLLGCLVLFLSACQSTAGYQDYTMTHADSVKEEAMRNRAWDSINQIQHLIRTGDLITRTGNDFTSESLRSLNQRNKDYSHCGIASIEHDSVFVYHALGGEWNPDQKIRRDPIALFAEPYSNKGFGIFRFSITETLLKQIVAKAREHYQQGVMFDMSFDLKTDDHMYCAEFVYKTMVAGSGGFLQFPHSYIGQFEFIGVDDLFMHPQCRLVHQIVFK